MKAIGARSVGILATLALVLGLGSVVFVDSPTPAHANTSSIEKLQQDVLKYTNQNRTKEGLKPLIMNTTLNKIATSWSKKMASKSGSFKHNPSYIDDYPSGWRAAGENIAMGYPSGKDVVDAWMDSIGHRKNILHKDFTHIGIGIAFSSTGAPYFTQNFGGYKGSVKGDHKTSTKSAKKKIKSAKPKIKGTAKVGRTLSVTRGSWAKGTKFKYQWFASGKTIKKATKKTYKLKPAQAGKNITVRVTGTKSGYLKTARASSKTKKVAKVKLKSAKPKIRGTKKVGKTLTVARGSWANSTKFKYQWYASGKAIKKATKKTYKLKPAQARKKISVRVTATKNGYLKTSRVSSKTKSIAS